MQWSNVRYESRYETCVGLRTGLMWSFWKVGIRSPSWWRKASSLVVRLVCNKRWIRFFLFKNCWATCWQRCFFFLGFFFLLLQVFGVQKGLFCNVLINNSSQVMTLPTRGNFRHGLSRVRDVRYPRRPSNLQRKNHCGKCSWVIQRKLILVGYALGITTVTT